MQGLGLAVQGVLQASEAADVAVDGLDCCLGACLVNVEVGKVAVFEPFPGGDCPGEALRQLLQEFDCSVRQALGSARLAARDLFTP